MKTKIGVLLSGNGTNLSALIDATKVYDYPAEIVKVISNNSDAYGLERAKIHNIDAEWIDHRPFKKDRIAHENLIHESLLKAGVEVICLAGYMRLLTADFVNKWQGNMLNIHPSLLPEFPGLHTHARAIAAGHKQHGCTVHIVTEVMDVGPIIQQSAVPVLEDDTPDTLNQRVLAKEHVLYPMALKTFILSRNMK